MAWFSVHESMYGGKLSALYQTLDCSEFEAVGILNAIWAWGLTRARNDGLLAFARKEEIVRYLHYKAVGSQLNPFMIVDALISTGWIDEKDGGFYIHDWDIWQEQWYKAKERREYDNRRQREYRRKNEEQQKFPDEGLPPPEPEEEKVEIPEKTAEKPAAKSPKPPPKKKYAEFVSMQEKEYGWLVEKYGKKFTDVCIEVLDNYKGSKGRTYKSDYRAILSWVAKRVNQDHPGLHRASLHEMREGVVPKNENPFSEYAEGN